MYDLRANTSKCSIPSFLGQKFDAVFIDACDNTRAMPCPAKVFLEEKVLENAKSLLKTMGMRVEINLTTTNAF